MSKAASLLVVLCLNIGVSAVCGAEDGQRVFRDPISGEVTALNQRVIDGWTIDTLPGGSMIVVSQKGKALVFVTDANDTGIQVDVMSADAKQLATIKGVDRPQQREIEYGTGKYWTTDADFDGQPDTRLELGEGMARVWYEGAWYLLQGDQKEKYIIVNGNRVAMRYKDGRFVRR